MAATSTPGTPPQHRYAEVAVDAPVGPGRTFTYSVPPSLHVEPGQAIWVPFGPQHAAGVVFATPDSSPVPQVRPLAGLQDPAPALSPIQLGLARWISRETRSSLYEAASLMLPFDFRRRLLPFLRPAQDVRQDPPPGLPRDQQRVLGYVSRHGAVELRRVRRALGEPSAAAARRLVRAGVLAQEWRWERPRARPARSTVLRLNVPRGGVPRVAATLSGRQAALLRHLSLEVEADAAQARKEFGPSVVSALRKKGLVEVVERRRTRDPLAGLSFPREKRPTLTADQERAVAAIAESLDGPRGAGAPRRFLLQGPTGSGKTEVYLEALERCIASGKRGVLLVPEISLTPQLVARLEGRFPGRVGLLHSGLTPGQQYDTWWRVRRGEFYVVLGSRSAVFAPQPDLGLIVLDEEHEWTYKQAEQSPRYHARDVALELASLCGASVVLGSATPDVASYHRAREGVYRLLTLPYRVRAGAGAGPVPAPMARAEVVDMREELKAGVRGIFSRALQGALRETTERGEQAILFLNRRGSAGTVQCRDCGHVLRCRRCETTLTYHSEGDRLVCHRCGRASPGSRACPACRSARIRHLGLGTQRVVQEVDRTLGVRALRWDRDAARERDAHQSVMGAFARGEAQVLVGTQMVAQGLHLPGVTLVGVVLADLGLHLPDFAAGERAFQLLCQVAGRAGRGQEPGRVIVQTYSPDHYAVEAGAAQDFHGFYKREIAYRREHRNPPFSHLARLLYQHHSASRCQAEAERLALHIRAACHAQGLTEVEVLGPAPAYAPRVGGQYRWQLVVRVLPSPAVDLPSVLEGVPLPPGWTVDVDPVSLV